MLCIYFLDTYKQEGRIHLEIVGIMEFFQLLIKFFFMLNIDGHGRTTSSASWRPFYKRPETTPGTKSLSSECPTASLIFVFVFFGRGRGLATAQSKVAHKPEVNEQKL